MRDFRGDKIPPSPVSLPTQFLQPDVDLEIGAGQGLHAIQYCQRNPSRRLIAIERTQVKFASFQTRIKNHPSLSNLLALRADAQAIVAHQVPTQSLANVFLLYPNPYPKPKQANLRWHRSPFIRCLHDRMATGGLLHLATNLEWYANEACQHLEKERLFCLKTQSRLKSEHVPRTHFEKKYLERSETCFDLVFEKWVQ